MAAWQTLISVCAELSAEWVLRGRLERLNLRMRGAVYSPGRDYLEKETLISVCAELSTCQPR